MYLTADVKAQWKHELTVKDIEVVLKVIFYKYVW